MNEVIQNMESRRSCRSFQKKQVEEETLAQILEAGLYAASGRGRQSAIMVVVQDPEVIAKRPG